MTTTNADMAAARLGLHVIDCPDCTLDGSRCPEALRLRAVAQAAQDARGAGVRDA